MGLAGKSSTIGWVFITAQLSSTNPCPFLSFFISSFPLAPGVTSVTSTVGWTMPVNAPGNKYSRTGQCLCYGRARKAISPRAGNPSRKRDRPLMDTTKTTGKRAPLTAYLPAGLKSDPSRCFGKQSS
ncbi:hypothetical protein LZ31DRAFT_145272 [Colletotrichum somersetense]|nr:hypothetical protein LZ31DRAFT_145272 [Colletotrichum somersetense]